MAKCEFMNPCGSTKDRAARRMVLDAEKKGFIKPNDGYTLIEPTSGNTGIGLALMAAAKGYETIFTLPDKMSSEKENVLTGLGAKVVRTRDVPHDNEESSRSVARKLANETSKSIMLDQYSNPSNPMAHYDQTAEELIAQCDGKIDYVVMTAGTGGTLSGIARKLKEKITGVKIIAADPYGSILAVPKSLNVNSPHPYTVEGNGKDFIPKNCEQSPDIIDQWLKITDQQSFDMARRLIKEEGMLVGGSSGTSMAGALEIAKSLPEDKRIVVIFTDGIRNYVTKYISDDWMIENGFMTQQEYDRAHYETNSQIKQKIPGAIKDMKLKKALIVKSEQTVGELLDLFEEQETQCAFAVNANKQIVGLLTEQIVSSRFLNGFADKYSPVKAVMSKEFRKLSIDDPIYYLSSVINRYSFVPIEDKEGNVFVCQPKDILRHFRKEGSQRQL